MMTNLSFEAVMLSRLFTSIIIFHYFKEFLMNNLFKKICFKLKSWCDLQTHFLKYTIFNNINQF